MTRDQLPAPAYSLSSYYHGEHCAYGVVELNAVFEKKDAEITELRTLSSAQGNLGILRQGQRQLGSDSRVSLAQVQPCSTMQRLCVSWHAEYVFSELR